MIIEPIILEVEKMNVYGIKKLPFNKNNSLVVMFHGFTGNHIEANRLFADLEKKILEEGIGTLRFDYRYHGDSDGYFEDFSLSAALIDAEHIMEHVLSDNRINHEKIGVIGLSLGGAVAIYISSRYDISTLVLWSAVSKNWFRKKLEIVNSVKDEYIHLYGAYRIKREKMLDIATFNIDEYLPRIKAPTLIIHARDDQAVTIDDPKYTYSKLTSKKKILWLDEGGHTFSHYDVKKYVIEKTTEWFKKYLEK